MCIEAIFIANGEGKLLYYRNYSNSLTQFLIEDFAFSLQSTFLKNNQHIFSSHGSRRLVYLPIEECLLVLVTDNSSNIVEDVESIGRIKEIVAALNDDKLTEESIFDNYVDLTMALDEMVNLKSRIIFTKTQISNLLAFESANEKVQQKLFDEQVHKTMKKNEAEIRQIERVKKVKDMLREEVNEIDRQVKEMSLEAKHTPDLSVKTKTEAIGQTNKVQKKGMQLGKSVKKQGADKVHTDLADDILVQQKLEAKETPIKFNPLNDEVKMLLEERISGQIDSSGNLRKFELKGTLNLFIENEQLDNFTVEFDTFDDRKLITQRLAPNFDKSAWNSGKLCLKPKATPLAKKTVVETLKYSLTNIPTTDTAPFKINFWFSGNQFSCEVDFNDSQSTFKCLENLEIRFKKLLAFDFEVAEVENSEFSTSNRYLVWKIPKLSSKSKMASLIVNFDEHISEESILPAEVDLESETTVFNLNISKIVDENSREVKFSFKRVLGAKDFTVEV